MSGAHYHVSYSQIIESERRIKLSSILKIFSKKEQSDYVSLKDMIDSCSSSSNEPSNYALNLDSYLIALKSFSTITFDSSLLQSVAFVGGYAVHSYLKQSVKCDTCMSLITQDKELEIVDTEDTYKLIQLIDRGALKWPSHIVIDAIIIVLRSLLQSKMTKP